MTFAFFQTHTKPHSARGFFFQGMFFGWVGDVLLMFANDTAWTLQEGLGCFLIGHIFYIFAYRKGVKGAWNLPLWCVAIAFVYAACLLVVLFPYVGEMFVPLVIYAVALLGMALAAKERQMRVSVRSFRFVYIGAVCFVASDSILAFNLFVKQHPAFGMALMALYAAAQYGICVGMLEQMREQVQEQM